MKRTTIKTLAKIAKTNNTPLLGKASNLANISFMEEYLSTYSLIDRNMQVTRGCFAPVWNRDEEDTDEEVLSQFQDDVYGLLVRNKNEYQRIWDALVEAEYNPISNYDKHSTITVSHTGEDNDTSTVGARHREESYGQKQNADAFGARSDSLTHGAQSSTDNFGAVSETTTHGAKETGTTGKRAGFNSSTLKSVEGATTNEGAQSDGHTEAARSDSHSSASYIDTNAVGAQSNSHTEAAHKDEFDENQAIDTFKKEFDSTLTTIENTEGNIGTKDNNQLLTGEVELRTRHKIYDIIENDIIRELCTLENDGYDCF